MKRVLIADDEPSVAQSLTASIDWDGLDLEVAAVVYDGQAALDFLRENPVDIAILDIRMRGCSGLELCQKLHHRNSGIQIIIISGYAEFSYAQKAICYGAIAYCLKPVDYAELTGYLLKAVRNLNKRLSKSYEYDCLLDAMEADDAASMQRILREFDMEADTYFLAVSIGESELRFERSFPCLTLRLGRNQNAYLAAASLEKSILKSGEQGENHGIGLLLSPVPLMRLKAALNDCTAMAYQFFIDDACRACTALESSADSLLLSEVSKTISFSNKEKVISLLDEIRENYCSWFSIRSPCSFAT